MGAPREDRTVDQRSVGPVRSAVAPPTLDCPAPAVGDGNPGPNLV